MSDEAQLYVFDAYGTMLDVHAAIGRFKDEIGAHADRMSDLWRIKQLEYTWTYSLMGRYRSFSELTAAALDTAAAMTGGLPPGMRTKLLAAYDELDAYPDVAPLLQRLRDRGIKTAILSNGSPAMLDFAVRAAGIGDRLDAVLSVDALAVYKPRSEVYALVGARFGTAPGDVAFLSSNRWDIAGAKAFGFRTIWVNRTGKPDEYPDLPPDRVVPSLEHLP